MGAVEKYISGQKDYDKIEAVRGEGERGEGGGEGEKTGVTPMVVISEERAKTHKTGYMTLYEKLFGGKQQNKKPKSFYRTMIKK